MGTPVVGISVALEADVVRLIRDTKKASDAVKKNSDRMKRDYDRLRKQNQMLTRSVKQSTAAIQEQTAVVKKGASVFGALGKAMATVFALKFAGQIATDIIKASDAVRLLDGRLKAVADDEAAFASVVEVAQELGATVQATGGLFTKLAIGTKRLGATTEEITAVTKAVLQLGRASGLSFAETDFFARQLGQGISSGNFQGDELRSLRENMPVLAQNIAMALTELDAFGDGAVTTAGDLKRLGKEGKLTSETMFRALKFLADSGIADAAWAKLPDTFEQASARVQIGWDLMLAAMTDRMTRSGIFAAIARIGEVFNQAAVDMAEVGSGSAAKKAGQRYAATWAKGFGDFIEGLGGPAGPIGRGIAKLAQEDLDRINLPLSDVIDEPQFEHALRRPWMGFVNTALQNADELREAISNINFSPLGGLRTEDQVQVRVDKLREWAERFKEAGAELREDIIVANEKVLANPASFFARQELADLNRDAETLSLLYEQVARKIEDGEKRLRLFKLTQERLLEDLRRQERENPFTDEGGTQSAGRGFDKNDQKAYDRLQSITQASVLRKEAAMSMFAALKRGGTEELERVQVLAKAEAEYARVVQDQGREVPGYKVQIIDALMKEYEATKRLNQERERQASIMARLRRDAEMDTDLLEQDGGLQSRGDITAETPTDQLRALREETANLREQYEAFSTGGQDALDRVIDAQAVAAAGTAALGDNIENDLGGSLRAAGEDAELWRQKIAKATEKSEDAMSQFAIGAARSMQSAFADYLFDPFEDGVKGMLKGFVDVIRRMIAEMVAFKVFEATGIAAFFGAAADGGPISAGKPYLVGEEGPEIVVPGRNSFVIPNHKIPTATAGSGMAMGGGGVHVTQNIDARGNDDPSRILAMMPEFAEAIKRDMRDERRRGI